MTPTLDKRLVELTQATIGFCGDSGDGMQLAGTQFTNASAILGNDISTLPDFPAEIRAPAGTLAGVSGFQVHFSSTDIYTPGDRLNALVAMNPAALKTNLKDLEPGGILIVNHDAFGTSDLRKAGYETNPLEDGSLKGYRVIAIPMTKLNREAVADVKLSPREADRCKNFFALGLVYWLYERPLEPTLRWIRDKFAKNPAVLRGQHPHAFKAGYNYGETTELLPVHYRVPKAEAAAGHAIARSPATRPWPSAWSPPPQLAEHAAGLRRLSRSRRPATSCTTWSSLKNYRRSLHPGRGRDRRDRHGHRRVVRRRASA